MKRIPTKANLWKLRHPSPSLDSCFCSHTAYNDYQKRNPARRHSQDQPPWHDLLQYLQDINCRQDNIRQKKEPCYPSPETSKKTYHIRISASHSQKHRKHKVSARSLPTQITRRIQSFPEFHFFQADRQERSQETSRSSGCKAVCEKFCYSLQISSIFLLLFLHFLESLLASFSESKAFASRFLLPSCIKRSLPSLPERDTQDSFASITTEIFYINGSIYGMPKLRSPGKMRY